MSRTTRAFSDYAGETRTFDRRDILHFPRKTAARLWPGVALVPVEGRYDKVLVGTDRTGVKWPISRVVKYADTPSRHSCDSRCVNAKGAFCECACEGVNHGRVDGGVRKNPSFTSSSDVVKMLFDDYAEMLGESYVGFDAHEIYVYRRWNLDKHRFDVDEADLEAFADAAFTLGNDYDEVVETGHKYSSVANRQNEQLNDYRLMRDALYAVARQARKKARGT